MKKKLESSFKQQKVLKIILITLTSGYVISHFQVKLFRFYGAHCVPRGVRICIETRKVLGNSGRYPSFLADVQKMVDTYTFMTGSCILDQCL